MLKKYSKKNQFFLNKLRKRIFYKTKFTQDKNKKNAILNPNLDHSFCTKPKADLHETQDDPNRVIISLKKNKHLPLKKLKKHDGF